MKVIYKFERDLITEQSKVEDAEKLFSEYLAEQLSDCASHNFLINKFLQKSFFNFLRFF